MELHAESAPAKMRHQHFLLAAEDPKYIYAFSAEQQRDQLMPSRMKYIGLETFRARVTHAAFGIAVLFANGCGSSLPEPPLAEPMPVRAEKAVEVPYPPPPARVEFVPERPRSGSVWIDGEWSWTGRRWAWTYGRWVAPPDSAKFSPWKTARSSDGTLLFVPGTWRNAAGAEITEPPPLARGRAREENVVTPPGHQEQTAPNKVPGTNPEAE
jgi:hypothetical protein